MARKRTKVVEPEPSRYSRSVDVIKDKLAQNSERISDLQNQAKTKMSENPMQTALISFGIGVIAGIGLKVLLESKRR